MTIEISISIEYEYEYSNSYVSYQMSSLSFNMQYHDILQLQLYQLAAIDIDHFITDDYVGKNKYYLIGGCKYAASSATRCIRSFGVGNSVATIGERMFIDVRTDCFLHGPFLFSCWPSRLGALSGASFRCERLN